MSDGSDHFISEPVDHDGMEMSASLSTCKTGSDQPFAQGSWSIARCSTAWSQHQPHYLFHTFLPLTSTSCICFNLNSHGGRVHWRPQHSGMGRTRCSPLVGKPRLSAVRISAQRLGHGFQRFPLYLSCLTEHRISGDVLCLLDPEGLKDVGVATIGQRLAILKNVYQLK